jgi:uncharacterized protein (DUF433 family)
MTLAITAQPVPLRADAQGTIRGGQTRVSLDIVVAAFQQGASAEEIVQAWPTLDLGDVYGVLAFYLLKQAAVDSYLTEQQRDAEAIRQEITVRQHPDPLRARLLALRSYEIQ